MNRPVANRVNEGWAALGEGRWVEARAFFEGAVTGEQTPEGFEGLSWAAWWIDDADGVFDAREHAYRLYKQRGDAAAAARMATWLACDQLDFRGASAVAMGWLGRAHSLLDPLETGPEHGWLAFLEGYMAQAAGDTTEAAELGRRATGIGRRFAVADLEMLGLALEGAALVARGGVRDGMRRLDEATATALEREAEVPISAAWACCFLVSACVAVRDYERASEWCDRIAEFAERYGSRYMLAFCRAEYGAVHLWRGRWGEAETLLESSVEAFSRSRPAFVAGPLVGLAELRRRQGRLEDAALLLDRAGASSAGQLCRAHMALDRGETARAVELAERYLRQLPAQVEVSRAPALELLVRARTCRGDLKDADSALHALREIGRAVGTDAMLAGVDLAAGCLAAGRGDHDRARPLFEDAIDGFARTGAPFEAARARTELATTLLALGRADEAEREAVAAVDQLMSLGAAGQAQVARRLLEESIRPEGTREPLPEITAREREVLVLLARGLTNRQIAERLVVSEHTVHRHVTNILRKLELPSRTAAAVVAARSGLLDRTGA
jgi:LuxR family transcriptional regulator, maltose regulon positive regulatory protein